MRFAPIPASLPHIVPFIGPETLERQRGAPYRARLGANENGFGPSPLAVEAMARAASEVWKYGDPDNYLLREVLAGHYGIRSDPIRSPSARGSTACLGCWSVCWSRPANMS